MSSDAIVGFDSWTPCQLRALDAIEKWDRRRTRSFKLAGYAGTGKSQVVAEIARREEGAVVVAPTGKAVENLRARGVQAKTTHSVIYFTKTVGEKTTYQSRRRITAGNGEPATLLVVDEASMVDSDMLADLERLEVPKLFVGDDGQLPPVRKDPRLMSHPDIRLDKIHRQEEGNPIIALAAKFRVGQRVQYYRDPTNRVTVVSKKDFARYFDRADAQFICGFNKDRCETNARVRETLGFHGPLPSDGERLICLQNNPKFELFNGQQVTCRGVGYVHRGIVELEIETADGSQRIVPSLIEQFGREKPIELRSHKRCLFDFGYCITAHRSQGSEWPTVVALEQIGSEWDAARWRYTVATRAKHSLIYCC